MTHLWWDIIWILSNLFTVYHWMLPGRSWQHVGIQVCNSGVKAYYWRVCGMFITIVFPDVTRSEIKTKLSFHSLLVKVIQVNVSCFWVTWWLLVLPARFPPNALNPPCQTLISDYPLSFGELLTKRVSSVNRIMLDISSGGCTWIMASDSFLSVKINHDVVTEWVKIE